MIATAIVFGGAAFTVLTAIPRDDFVNGQITDELLARTVANVTLVSLVAAAGIGGLLAMIHPMFGRRYCVQETSVTMVFALVVVPALYLSDQLAVAPFMLRRALIVGGVVCVVLAGSVG